MKTSTFLLFFFLFVISISVEAQNDYQFDNYEIELAFDTLPGGTEINFLEDEIKGSSTKQVQFKSIKKHDKGVEKYSVQRQQNDLRSKQFKSGQLIKSLNQEISPYYMEKLDSIVEFNAVLFPRYDSLGVQNTIQKFNENGYLIESIIQSYDSTAKKLINAIRYEYTPNSEGKLLKQINYKWTGDVWGVSDKSEREYSSVGLITRSTSYIWTGSGWANSGKVEYEYNTNGKQTFYRNYRVDNNGEWIIYLKMENTYYENGLLSTQDYYSVWNAINNNWNDFSHLEFNEQGQRTLSSYMKYNTETKQLEYNYKYEYEYLEDGSTVETRFGWNTALNEFYQQSQNRYKLERQYQNEKLMQEVRMNYVNGNWEYNWKKVYDYDQWGNEILYEFYNPYWGDYGELKELRTRSFSAFGQLDRLEQYRWEFDEDYGYYKKMGVQFYEYKRNADGKLIIYARYKWDEEKEEWLVDLEDYYSYPIMGESIIERYKFIVNGYFPEYVKDYKTILEYDTSIGRYSAITEEGEKNGMQIFYNNDKKVKEIIYYYEGEPDDRIECYYDVLGRDSLWISFYPQTYGDLDTSIYFIQFSYKNISDDQMEVTEFYYDNKPDTVFGENGEILNFDTDELIKYTLKDDNMQKMIEYRFEEGRWIAGDSTYFNYNSLGQIIAYGNETGDYKSKYEYNYSNDSLTVRDYSKNINSEIVEWELDDIEVYIIDPNTGKNHFQKIPAAIWEDGKTYWYEWHFMFDYGKPLEILSYSKNSNDYGQVVNGTFEISYKTNLFYSPASALQGEGTISGYIFNDSGANKSIMITNTLGGEPVEGAVVLLCASEDNFILAKDTTGADGFYEFKGVPEGNFYIKVELQGYVQTSTHEIYVTKDAASFENKNYKVLNGEVVVGIDELKYEIQVFPNPASGFVYINSPDIINALKVIDMGGRTKFMDNEINSKSLRISTETIPEGLYIFEIETEKKIFRGKVIIKK